MKHINILKLFLVLMFPLLFMACNSGSDTVVIVPSAKLNADFTITANALEIAIKDNSTLTGAKEASRKWDFGDGTEADGNAESHKYARPGGYTVMLTVKDDTGDTYQASKAVTIAPVGVTVDFSYTYSGKNVTFKNESKAVNGTLSGYSWTFGNSKTSTDKDPVNEYADYGVYTVTMSLKDNYGLTHTITKEVPVSPVAVTPNFDYTTDTYTVSFTDKTVVRDGTIKSRSWDFDDGSEYGTGTTASHLYAAGSYDAVLTIMDSADIEHKITKKITVMKAAVTPDFTYSADMRIVNLTNTTSINGGTIKTYEWNFGDSSQTVDTKDASHEYLANGEYLVTLKMVDNYNVPHTMSKKVTVGNPYVTADFTYKVDGYTAEFTAAATVLQGTITGYSWHLGETGVADATGEKASHKFGALQNYTVTLTVTDNSGATTKIAKPVAISLAQVTPQFEYTVKNYLTVDVASTTNVTGGRIESHSWNFGDGSAPETTSSASHNYTTFGDKTVKLTIVDNYGITHETAQLVPLPKPDVKPDFTITRAAGSRTATFTNTTAPDDAIAQYVWSFGDGKNFTGKDASHDYLTTGNFNVTLEATDIAGEKHTITKNIGISPVEITPDFTYVREGTTLKVNFTDTSLPAGNVKSRKWTFTPTDTADTLTPSFTFAALGEYDVTLAVTDTYGVTHSVTKKVYLNTARVQPDFTITRDANNYLLYEFENTSKVFDGTITNYKWMVETSAIIPTTPKVSHTFASTGIYQVTLEVTDNNGLKYSTTKQLTVQNTVTLQARFSVTHDIVNRKTIIFTNETFATNGYSSFEWDFGDGTKDTANWKSVTHTYAEGKEYKPKLTVVDNFGMKSAYQIPVQTTKFIKSVIGYQGYNAALTDNGEVYVWGGPNLTSANREFGIVTTPVKAELPAGTVVIDIAVNMKDAQQKELGGMIFVLTSAGEVYAWGENGILFGAGDESVAYSTTPRKIVFPTSAGKIKAISIVRTFAFALGEDGAIYGWGNSLTLNFADETERGTKPAKLAGFTQPVTKIFATYQMALAVTNDGKLWHWGRNKGTPEIADAFFDGSTPEKFVKEMAVASNYGNSNIFDYIVLTQSGDVYVWGANGDGFIGTGTAAGTPVTRTKLDIGGERAASISKSIRNTAVVTESGNLYMWGKNNSGQLGVDNYLDQAMPQKVKLPYDAIASNATLTIDAQTASCVTVAGEVWGWGYNLYELGLGNTKMMLLPVRILPIADNAVPSVTPQIAARSYGKKIAFFNASRMAFESGTTYEWDFGDNSAKSNEENTVHTYATEGSFAVTLKIIQGTTEYSVTRTVDTKEIKFTDISAGTNHVVALDSDNKVWTWGNNDSYQLGLGDTLTRYTAKKLNSLNGLTVARTSSIAAGHDHSFLYGYKALSSGANSDFYAWGRNESYQLGLGNVTGDVQIPTEWASSVGGGFTDVILQIATGNVHSLGIDEKGITYAWGLNDKGQLGVGGGNSYMNVPVAISYFINNSIKTKFVDAASSSSFAVSDDGKLYAWGAPNDGKLGLNTTLIVWEPTPVDLGAGVLISTVAAGESHSLALAQDGSKVYSFGNNESGALGIGTFETPAVGTINTVKFPEGVGAIVQIAAGRHVSAAITVSGKLYVWGNNESGFIGTGSTDYPTVPTLVKGLPDDVKVKKVSIAKTGRTISALLEDGRIFTWGLGDAGQLGQVDIRNRALPTQLTINSID